MNTFLPESVVGRQFDIERQDLSERRKRRRGPLSRQRDQYAATADIGRINLAFRPHRGRTDVTAQPDVDSRIFTPVGGLHFWAGCNTATVALKEWWVQYRKWVTATRWRRLSELNRLALAYKIIRNLEIYPLVSGAGSAAAPTRHGTKGLLLLAKG